MNAKGFTLLELLVVFIVISVLAAIAIPVFVSHVDSARHSAVKNCLAEGYRIAQLCFHDEIDSLDSWAPMAEHGMQANTHVDIWIVDGHRTADTLLLYAQHKKRTEIRYQVDFEGRITRRQL